MGGEFGDLGDVFGGRGRYIDAVASLVLSSCANVPAVNAVNGPGVADGRGFMN